MDNNKKLRSKSRLEHHKNIFERKKGELIQLKKNIPNLPIINIFLLFSSLIFFHEPFENELQA